MDPHRNIPDRHGLAGRQRRDLSFSEASSKGKCEKFKKKITRDDIGVPTNFRHVAHVGWKSEDNFETELNSEEVFQPTPSDDVDKNCKKKTKLTRDDIGEPTNFMHLAHVAEKPKKKKIKPDDISLPTNFEHRAHVRWDPDEGHQTGLTDNVDPAVVKLLVDMGLLDAIKNKEELQIAIEQIEQFGGVI